jgi:glyoxylase-like metal-dependent hydrolase (beta-lactamase superfamily II)
MAMATPFPNARIVAQQQEWDDALANKSTMSKTYLRSHLDPIADQLQTADGAQQIEPGLSVMPMPGHTWGQHAITFDDGDGLVCFPGDVMPTVHHAGPTTSMGYDMLPHVNMQSKAQLLDRARRESWRLVLDHEPGNPVVRVSEDPDRAGRFRLEPQEIAGAV